jgi:hypothetical protein
MFADHSPHPHHTATQESQMTRAENPSTTALYVCTTFYTKSTPDHDHSVPYNSVTSLTAEANRP